MLQEVVEMATNSRRGGGSRVGAVRRRSQTWNPRTRSWVKRGEGGLFMSTKATPFKGVRKDRNS
jgi:hypothetical protein